MKFESVKSLAQAKVADFLILPFWKGKKKAEPAAPLGAVGKEVAQPIDAGDFTGKEGETALVYPASRKEKRILLIGLGEEDKVKEEVLRRAFGAAGRATQKAKATTVNLLPPKVKGLKEGQVVHAVAEGLLLVNYAFERHKAETIKDEAAVLLKSARLIGVSAEALKEAERAMLIAEGVYVARDLINTNADEADPQHLAALAKSWGKTFAKVKTTVFDRKRIEKEKMDLLLAVGRGSHVDPAFIMMEYKGDPRSKEHTVLVGKGVTYDTGGLNLKPTGFMEDMKCDMSGAAVVFGTLYAAVKLGLKKNITVVVAATENAIGAHAYKPGDVYGSYQGKTVEIGNTDAEGRLTLADALAYSVKNLKPTRVINLATLTGAMVVALGEEVTGMMSNNDDLANQLYDSGQSTYERVWRLPLYEEYREQLKSDVADIKNCSGRDAGSITAGIFLQEFVGEIPWAHLDIAGTAYHSKPRRYHPKNGTGIGVRLLMDFLEHN